MDVPAASATAVGARAPTVDAVRGFALLGIILVNAPFFAFDLTVPPPPTVAATDGVARWLVLALATGKFFPIFSFLFGFGFAVLLRRSDAAGAAFDAPYLRRLAGLLVLGVGHAVFLFAGDILVLYALLGLALWALRRWSDRALVTVAAVSMVVAVPSQSLVLTADLAELAAAPAGPGYLGGFAEVTARRVADLPMVAMVVGMFNGPSAFAMFLLGFVAARRGLFPPSGRLRSRLRRPAVVAGAAGAVVSAGAAALLLGHTPFEAAGVGTTAKGIAAVAFSTIAPLLSFALVVGLLELAERRPASAPVRTLALVGRSTLSGYLLHSLLLGAVFFGWGLGLFGALGPAAVLVAALATFAAISLFLHGWGRWFRYGPAEWLLRCFVELRWIPMLRRAPAAREAGIA